MFERIKMRVIQGRKLKPFAVANVLQDHEDRLKALEEGSDSDSQQEPATPATQNISFTINDGTNPIEGASVVIDETTKTTGSAGGCSFNDIAEGSVSVTVSADGYTSKTETITVSSENTSFTISLTSA